MSTHIKKGDVFAVPLGDGRAGMGQVVGNYGKDAYFFAIFDVLVSEDEAEHCVGDALGASIVFLALSLDGKIHAGHWTVVGRGPVPDDVPLPAFKEAVGGPSQFDVVDSTGSRRRPATPSEVDRLPNRKVVAPVRLEKALLALHGLEPWLDVYDELRAEHLVTAAEVFG